MTRYEKPFETASPATTADGQDVGWEAFGVAAYAFEPLSRAVTTANLQMVALAGCRTRAWLEIPDTLARCQTPHDLMTAQADFWRTARRDYMAAGSRVLSDYLSAMSEPELSDPEQVARSRDDTLPARSARHSPDAKAATRSDETAKDAA